MSPLKLYHYKAYVTRVHSGDTCRVDLDLGMGVWVRSMEIQLHRLEAPETKGATRTAGLAARDFLRELILDREVLLRTIKDRSGKSGLYLGEMTVVNESGETFNVNESLIEAGHATYREAPALSPA